MNPYEWCLNNGVSHLADNLARALAAEGLESMRTPVEGGELGSEARQQSIVRIEAAKADILLWRNNVGVLKDVNGRPVRYGLANDSKQMNEVIKSADLIGIRKLRIEKWMLGGVVGQFVSREIKEEGWKFNPNDQHEAAQQTWGNLIAAYGGDAKFASGEGSFK